MHDDVVGGVEGAGVVVVQDGCRFVGTLGFHVDEACWFSKRALSAEDKTVTIVGATVGHEVTLGAADFVASEVGRGEDFQFRDDDGLIAGGGGFRGGVGDLVGSDEEGICGGVEDAGFVEVGGARVVNEALELRGGAEEGEEGIVVDEERFRLGVRRIRRGNLSSFCCQLWRSGIGLD